MQIEKLRAREVLDSRGNPTVEAEVMLADKTIASAIVPSGASTGEHEAFELRDNDKSRFLGRGVLKAVNFINVEINNKLCGLDIRDQAKIDNIMIDLDGTNNKSRLGANTILAVSLACAHALANYKNKPLYRSINSNNNYQLPVPMMNIINGGRHANNNIDIQEFMIIPACASSFKEALRYGVETFYHLKAILKKKKMNLGVGDEGGFAPQLNSNEEAITIILEAIDSAGYKAGKDIFIGLDIASSELYSDGRYYLTSEDRFFTNKEFVSYLMYLIDKYPIISIEDAMDENDWEGWSLLTKQVNNRVQLVGDDLFATNGDRLTRGINAKVANSILIKVNQIGTLTEALATMDIARNAGYSCIVSHRSGETEDTTIADLAVATACGQIKTGSLMGSERLAKYNRLLRIEEELGSKASYAGIKAFNHLKY